MSKIFGPVIQQGYVVPDWQEAIQHWLARGVGPFFVEHLDQIPGEVNGEAVKLDLTAAFAYSGDQQIEVIQPRCETPSIYRDYLEENPAGGLQHLAVWVDNIEESLAEYAGAGVEVEVKQRYGDGHAYLDMKASPGVMIQLMAHNDAIDLLFSIIKEASDNWDGKSDPVRTIDWSTGKPVVKA